MVANMWGSTSMTTNGSKTVHVSSTSQSLVLNIKQVLTQDAFDLECSISVFHLPYESVQLNIDVRTRPILSCVQTNRSLNGLRENFLFRVVWDWSSGMVK